MRDAATNVVALEAAVRMMARHEVHSLEVEEWVLLLEGSPLNVWERIRRLSRVRAWLRLFESRPDLFQFDQQRRRVALVARSRNARLWHVDRQQKISLEEYMNLPGDEKKERITRSPLSEEELSEVIRQIQKEEGQQDGAASMALTNSL